MHMNNGPPNPIMVLAHHIGRNPADVAKAIKGISEDDQEQVKSYLEKALAAGFKTIHMGFHALEVHDIKELEDSRTEAYKAVSALNRAAVLAGLILTN